MSTPELRFVRESVTRAELGAMADAMFGDMVKAVVDLERGLMVIGGEMHSDEETALLDDGSRQEHLWGINLYPAATGDDFIEYDSMINVRPRAGNRSRSVEDSAVRAAIVALVARLVRA